MSSSDSPTDAESEGSISRCPTCNDVFPSKRAVKDHHTKAHDERLVEHRVCEECGEEYEPNRPGCKQRFCSVDCKHDALRQSAPESEVDKDGQDQAENENENENENEAAEDTHCCPTCGETFATRRALKIHHTKVHNESLVGTRECERAGCSEEFRAAPSSEQRYCSRECHAEERSTQVTLTCPGCEELFAVHQCEADRRRYCSRECQKAHNHVTLTCDECGDEFDVLTHREDTARFCSANCRGRVGGRASDQGKRSTVECRICYDEVGTYRPERRRYCSNRCRIIGMRTQYPYHPRNASGREGFEKLVNHCYFAEGHDIDATTRIVRRRLVDGEQWTRDDVEELTGEILKRPRKVDQRLSNLRPEDLGLSPLGDRTASGEDGVEDDNESVSGSDAIGLMGVGR